MDNDQRSAVVVDWWQGVGDVIAKSIIMGLMAFLIGLLVNDA